MALISRHKLSISAADLEFGANSLTDLPKPTLITKSLRSCTMVRQILAVALSCSNTISGVLLNTDAPLMTQVTLLPASDAHSSVLLAL